MRCLAVAFFCVLVVATSSSQTDAPKEAQKQSIQGKVVEVSADYFEVLGVRPALGRGLLPDELLSDPANSSDSRA
jgi:hypothetical protein